MNKKNKSTGSSDSNRAYGRILIVDDDEICRSVNEMMLEQAGHVVEAVAGGLAAIESLKKREFDLVFMDCSMPVMDGFATTRAIRASAPELLNKDIPIVALTGLSSIKDLAKCKDAGMNDILIKPVDSHQLLKMADRFLEPLQKDRARSGQFSSEPDAGFAQPSKEQMEAKSKAVQEFQESIIDKFLLQLPQVISDLEKALLEHDMPALQFIAHKFRGPADVVGAKKLSFLAGAVEAAVKDNNATLVFKHVSELMDELKKLRGTYLDSPD